MNFARKVLSALNFIDISDINKNVKHYPNDFVSVSESAYNRQLHDAADEIAKGVADFPIVLLSGPSGSGKTTTAMRIGSILSSMGIPSHILSMDNYFLPGNTKDLPVNEDGSVDLESPYRLDIPLLNEQINMINRCEAVDVPQFDFATQSRPSSVPMKRNKGEVVIIEGIHALNPEVTGQVSDFAKGVYVSVRTRIRADNGDLLHPRLIRLMRRVNRDKLFRGRKIEEIFTLFESVSRGEDLYIMPHKHRASIEIDTFLPYEASVYKEAVYDQLKICAELSGNGDYETICRFMNELEPLNAEYSPKNSLVREFVGGSEYSY